MDRQQFSVSYGGDNYAEDYYSEGNVLLLLLWSKQRYLMRLIKIKNSQKPDYYELYDDQLEDANQYYEPNINSEIHSEPSFWSNLTFRQLCTQCVVPAVWSTGNLLGTTLILCIFFKIFIVICKQDILC